MCRVKLLLLLAFTMGTSACSSVDTFVILKSGKQSVADEARTAKRLVASYFARLAEAVAK